MASYVWVYKDAESFKVWGYELYKGETTTTVVYYWGPCGKPMHQLQKREHKSAYFLHITDEIIKRVQEKEREGYKKVPNHVYFDAIWKFIETIERYM